MVVFRGENLAADVTESDPSQTGLPPLPIKALTPEAGGLADIANKFIAVAKDRLTGSSPANMILLRGFSTRPSFPTMQEIYKLNPLAIAVYPMYRGVARLVGMDVIETGVHATAKDEFEIVADNWADYDFFFVHIKPTDSRGEDGDIEAKAEVIEEVDAALGTLLDLDPDVLIITGDHSTPARLKSHSWHPVPTLLRAPASHLQDAV